MYELVNRSMIIVKPKKPFLDWANGVDGDHNDFTQKEMEDDCAVFLIQDFEEDQEKEKILKRHYTELFEAELGGWCTDEKLILLPAYGWIFVMPELLQNPFPPYIF